MALVFRVIIPILSCPISIAALESTLSKSLIKRRICTVAILIIPSMMILVLWIVAFSWLLKDVEFSHVRIEQALFAGLCATSIAAAYWIMDR